MLAAALAVGGAALANPLTDMIAAEDPCADLPGLSRTDYARVDSASVGLAGEKATLRASGRVRCTTSPGALFQADASARITVDAALDLSDCSVTAVTVTLDAFGGSAVAIIDFGKEAIAAILETEIRRGLRESCQKLSE